MIPALYDLLQGKVSNSTLREVRAFLGAFLPEAQLGRGNGPADRSGAGQSPPSG